MKKIFILFAVLCCTMLAKASQAPSPMEIWYTSTDGQVVTPRSNAIFGFMPGTSTALTITSNSYDGDKGIIRFSGTVTQIGQMAFFYCDNLATISLPSTVTKIETEAFVQCTNLNSITIPSAVTDIKPHAIDKCSGLESIIVESGNTVYDSRNGCNAIIETASNKLLLGCKNTTIPDAVTKINDYAFEGCSGLTSITIPNNMTEIGYMAFYGCTGLSSIEITNNVTSIGSEAFFHCTNLTSVNIPSGVTSIEYNTFCGCSSLISITLPNGVESIGESAFEGCTSLNSVSISSSVTNIGNHAFYNCQNLSTIAIESGNSVYDSRSNCNALIETASNTLLLGCKNTSIPNTVTRIEDQAFENCIGLTSIAIPNSITYIGTDAFKNCTGLTSATIPNSVTATGTGIFYGCTGMISATISDNMARIEDNTFNGCTGLSSITISNSITRIGASAFKSCSSLNLITIPSSVTSIGSSAFQYCSNLYEVFCKNTTPPTLGTDVFAATPPRMVIYVPTSSVAAYKAAGGWNMNGTQIQGLDLDSYIAIALAEIDAAMQGVDNLSQADLTAIENYKATISASISVNAIDAAKEAALAIISLQRAKNEAIAEILTAMQGVTNLSQEDLTAIENYKAAINAAYIEDEVDVAKEAALAIISLRRAKNDAIAEINAAMEGVNNFLTEEQNAINGYLNEINTATMASAINAPKEAALAIISLRQAKNDAIAEIQTAVEGITIPSVLDYVNDMISQINNGTNEIHVTTLKNNALEYLALPIACFNDGKAAVLGTMGEPQNGPAIEVTKGDKSIKLYQPDKVEFIMVNDEK